MIIGATEPGSLRVFLKTGSVDLMIVPKLTKPNNNILLTRMLENILGIPETDKRKYNLDNDFLERQVEIVVGVMDCQVTVMDMREEGLNNIQYHPRVQASHQL